MTPLRQQMIDAMVLRGLAGRTQESYVAVVAQLARYYHCSPPSSTVRLQKSRFLRNRASVHAGFKPFSKKVLWWHVCNNGTQS